MPDARGDTEYRVEYLNSKGLPVIDYVWAQDPDAVFHDWSEHYGSLRHILTIRPVCEGE